MKYIGNLPEQNIQITPSERYDYVMAGPPAVDTNPSCLYATWLNMTTCELFICKDNTVGANVWSGLKGVLRPIKKYTYDGLTSLSYISGYTGLLGSASRTFECWMLTSDTVNEVTIFEYGDTETAEKFRVRVETSNGSLRLEIDGGYVYGSTKIDDNTWHHIAVVLDGTTLADTKLYVDGELETISSSSGTTLTLDTTSNVNVAVGYSPLHSGYSDIELADIRFWNVARSASEISDYMARSIYGAKDTLEFNILTGLEVDGNGIDYSGNSRNLTLSGVVISDVDLLGV